ncbi:MAG: hypothetical protein GX594_05435 [Pirellulaceae bacterium]|nr:hypothetical protein [Pirellulaceae bacterium]
MADVAQPNKSMMELALALTPRVQIQDIRLENSTIRSKLSCGVPAMRVEYAMNAGGTVDHDTKELLIHASLMVCAKIDSELKPAEELFYIAAELILRYSLDATDGFDEEHINAFGRLNGIHNVWPYWREYVQSTTVRLGLPPLTLPLMTGDSLLAYFAKSPESNAATG